MQQTSKVATSAKPVDPMLGRVVAGRYRLEARAGEGGMGIVYRARHVLIDRVVALKLIRPERLAHDDAVGRFRRDVQAAAALSHPNILHAYDADQISGTQPLVIEAVPGPADADLGFGAASGQTMGGEAGNRPGTGPVALTWTIFPGLITRPHLGCCALAAGRQPRARSSLLTASASSGPVGSAPSAACGPNASSTRSSSASTTACGAAARSGSVGASCASVASPLADPARPRRPVADGNSGRNQRDDRGHQR